MPFAIRSQVYPNRASCQNDLAERFAVQAPPESFAVVQIDLDNFKRVNDTLGHAAGDYLLRVLGERLKIIADAYTECKPYRWGGDEFIAIIEQKDDTVIGTFCQELTDSIAIPVNYENATLNPTVSLGIARYPEDAKSIEELMIFSDLALYKTKELGRDGYQFFTTAMKDKVDHEARIEADLRAAIEQKTIRTLLSTPSRHYVWQNYRL